MCYIIHRGIEKVKKQTLYKKFFKLGSRIDNMCFRYIQYDLVDDAISNLWELIRWENVDVKTSELHEFADKFFKIKNTLEQTIKCYNGKINSTEFKDTKLLVRLEIKHKLNKLKTAHLDLSKFEQNFLDVFGISLFESKNYIDKKELEKAKISNN